MAAYSSIKVQKSFTYRGSPRVWSNRYYFKTGTPADSAHWTTLSDAIVTAEKACFASNVTIVGTVGYAAGSEVPVFSKTYSTAGTWASGTAESLSGDSAILLRWSTAARTSKNHPVYLFNYYHGVFKVDAASGDTPAGGQSGNIGTYATSWISGFSDGTNTYVRCGPNGAAAIGSHVDAYVRHRDFPT